MCSKSVFSNGIRCCYENYRILSFISCFEKVKKRYFVAQRYEMSRKRNIALAVATAMFEEEEENVLPRSARRLWVHDINLNRRQYGAYHTLVQELRLSEKRFKAYFRLSRGQMEELLLRVGPAITKEQTHMRETISAPERLCICIR